MASQADSATAFTGVSNGMGSIIGKCLLLAEGVEELCCQQPANVIPFFLVVLRKEHGNDGTRSRTTRPTFL